MILERVRESRSCGGERLMRSSIALDEVLRDKKRESSPSDVEGTSSEEANFSHLLDEDQHSSQPIVP
jgi:hypothetical protein